MIFDVEMETLPREDLEALQFRRLKSLCDRVYANVSFYKRSFDEKGIKPVDIQSLSDLKYLPFTEKQDLRNHYPFGLFAVPKDNVVRIHASSGTTGKATVVGYTQRDVNNWATLMARSFMAAGAGRRDIIHNAYGYGLFTGGLGAHYGAERLGATIVPVSGGGTKRQVVLLRDFGATVICCTPSYSLFLYETALEAGIDMKEQPLRIGIFGAEPWTEEMRRDIEAKMGIKAIDIYGLSEIMGPGVGIECIEAQAGAHLMEDHFLCEIIDPETGEQLPPGSGHGHVHPPHVSQEADLALRIGSHERDHYGLLLPALQTKAPLKRHRPPAPPVCAVVTAVATPAGAITVSANGPSRRLPQSQFPGVAIRIPGCSLCQLPPFSQCSSQYTHQRTGCTGTGAAAMPSLPTPEGLPAHRRHHPAEGGRSSRSRRVRPSDAY